MPDLIKQHRLTPEESAAIRAEIADYIRTQLIEAHSVVMGDQKWSPTQARVFTALLAKVVPDLTANFVQHEAKTRNINELTREELEAIAQGTAYIDVEATEPVPGINAKDGSVLEHDNLDPFNPEFSQTPTGQTILSPPDQDPEQDHQAPTQHQAPTHQTPDPQDPNT